MPKKRSKTPPRNKIRREKGPIDAITKTGIPSSDNGKELSNEKAGPYSFTRKDAVRTAALMGAAAGIAVLSTAVSRVIPPPPVPEGNSTVRTIPPMESVDSGNGADILLRMQDELRRALAKPMEARRWLMVIDTRKCVGCHACTVACMAENKLPPGVVYRPVVTEETGKYPRQVMRFFPRPCMQCDNPSCVNVCPVRATWKRPDGVVIVDYDRCIGCRYCLTACPYGARTSDFGNYYTEYTPEIEPYEKKPNHEYRKSWDRAGNHSPVGNARKCHFCLHRLEDGLLPQCVSTCIGRANYFGDGNDATSLAAEMARSHNQVKLLEEMGTKPTVIYLV